MQDCYKILGVSHKASLAEIRSAYRQKAKLLHPDITHSDSEAFRQLVEAYETLSNAKSRSLFDESYAYKNYGPRSQNGSKESFDYRKWLLERNDDESRAKLIFYDLTHHNEEQAVAEFKRMNMTKLNFRLSQWFTREDFMDYGFILSEELIIRREFYDAVILLDQIIRMNYSYNYFKLFFPEVKSLLRYVLRNNLEGVINDELAIDAWEKALDLQYGNDDDAFFLSKMADAYERMGDTKTARICREESHRLAS